MWTQFAHLQYYSEYNQKVLNIFQKESRILSLEHTFSFSDTGEEFRSLFQNYSMTNAEIRKVKQYYATALDLAINDIGVISDRIQKYGKLRTKSGVLIGSKLANRKGDIARNNYSIAAKLLVDKNAHLPRAPVDFEKREFYGQIFFYFVHELNNELSMLAFVVINVAAIDRCVGFLEIAANQYIIIDRENWVTFR
ncbi:unnamed protein product [Rhizophagus irregularis]|nr:unnamed protein product [Rhizophagus irregularis]